MPETFGGRRDDCPDDRLTALDTTNRDLKQQLRRVELARDERVRLL